MPLRFVGSRELARACVGASSVAAVTTLVVGAVLDALHVPDRARVLAALAGCALALVTSVIAARRKRTERALTRLVALLPRAARPGLIRRLMLERTERLATEKLDVSARVSLLCQVTSALRGAGFDDDAGSIIASIDAEPLAPGARAAVTFERAAIALGRGELEAADAVLAGDDGDAAVALRALSHAVQGGADQALACLERGDFQRESGAIAAAARAHALASMGRDDDARRVLGELVASRGLASLAWVLRPVGPATDYARTLLRGAATSPSEGA